MNRFKYIPILNSLTRPPVECVDRATMYICKTSHPLYLTNKLDLQVGNCSLLFCCFCRITLCHRQSNHYSQPRVHPPKPMKKLRRCLCLLARLSLVSVWLNAQPTAMPIPTPEPITSPRRRPLSAASSGDLEFRRG